jgi:Protein of unknown function (DUF2490)
MKITKGLIIFLVFFFATEMPADAQVNDAGIWLSLNAEKKITSKVSIDLSQEFRLNENIAELGTAFTETGVSYKFNKHFSSAVFYRFIQKRQGNDFYEMRHRMFIDVTYKQKFKKVNVSLRQRIQSQVNSLKESRENMLPEYKMRTKLTVKYDFDKKYTPFVSSEIFYPVFNNNDSFIDNIRYAIGFDYEFNKRHAIALYYLINKEVNVSDLLTEFISGISYKYSF